MRMTRSAAGPTAAGETALLAGLGSVLAALTAFWLASEAGASVAAGGWVDLPAIESAAALARLPRHLASPLGSWPAAPQGAAATAVFYGVVSTLATGALCAAVVAAGGARRGQGRRHGRGARWARRRDLTPLRVRRCRRGRLVIGRLPGRPPALVATETRHSLLVIGPTQSGKTSGLAVPAILEWDGPVVATSVKDDLAGATFGWRSQQGPCALFDPTGGTALGAVPARWSPVEASDSWTSAQKMAACLVECTPGRRGLSDAAFWYAAAAKQLAPLLLAAQRGGLTVADVVRWTDAEDFDEPGYLLHLAGEEAAALALSACAGRDERIRSSVTTTLETVLAPFADPEVARSTATTDLPVTRLLERSGTLYLCGPSHEQHRVAGLFSALVASVVDAATSRAAGRGGTLDPPLLLVLDEAANIAPLRDLDTLASTGAGLGIQLVTVCQDLAQLASRYGADRARTIANNHRGKLLLSGVADLGTLDLISGLAGEERIREVSTTRDLRDGGITRATSSALRRLAPTDQLRRTPPGEGVLVYGHLLPARVRLRPWYAERVLRRRASPPLAYRPPPSPAPPAAPTT
jgi:type IV secretion system protein VirD4